ncbi:hypothetical protein F0562_036067 [Nyssa sinensis]|uniref:Uncharacterized protein n=1 Tax=Nyssa sinensis TaxID=561372 RepID=A0A5J5AFU5_9ASTE|nr:hypothetical protein F0562_036067 [Nyssa sinensis]
MSCGLEGKCRLIGNLDLFGDCNLQDLLGYCVSLVHYDSHCKGFALFMRPSSSSKLIVRLVKAMRFLSSRLSLTHELTLDRG